ncbi:MAG: FumA C-terminus/TtdB family hydratase beta subunit [Syntrophales bacterium]|nr:FumA C-terminus/TtdB family hydratase beta subunit [Syntrophales bacterium]
MRFTVKLAARKITSPLREEVCVSLHAGDWVYLSGEVFTARDVAHRLLCEMIERGETLPIPIVDSVIFYGGPTPLSPGNKMRAIGPTTSARMDPFTPCLLKAGLRGMIGKGKRASEVVAALRKHKAVYFAALGGVAAYTARCVKYAEVIAFPELEAEAIHRLIVEDLPLVVINDTEGRDFYEEVLMK